MKQKLNIYIGNLALAELGRLANVRGLSRGKVVEELVLGAEKTDVTDQDVAGCMARAMEKLPRTGPSDERIDSAEEGS